MKKNILFVISFFGFLILPINVWAANTFDIYSPADSYASVAFSETSLESVYSHPAGLCITNPALTDVATCGYDNWAPVVVVMSGDDLTISEPSNFAAVFIVDGLDLTINNIFNLFGAATIDGNIIVSGNGKANVAIASYISYIGNSTDYAFDTSATGSAVSLTTLNSDGETYATDATHNLGTLLRDLLGGPGHQDIYNKYTIDGKVTLRENLGLLGKDKLVINANGELVVSPTKSLDNRNNVSINENGKLTIDNNATLYNVGQIRNDGIINGNGTILNGARSTNGEVVRLGIGEIANSGTININNKLDIVENAEINNSGKIVVAPNSNLVNPARILLLEGGSLENQTSNDITVKKFVVGAIDPVDVTIPAAQDVTPAQTDNPQTSDSVMYSVILLGFSLLTITSLIVYNKKKSFN